LVLALLAMAAFALHLPNFYETTEGEDPAVNIFMNWATKFNKEYASQEEVDYRFQIFKQNQEIIKWMQMTDESAVYGPTQFADLTTEEFSNLYLNFRVPYVPTDSQRVKPAPKDIPDEWDWRTYEGVVTPVRSQGQCGSCWAFSAVHNLEGQVFLKKTKSVKLSPQQLVDCDTQSQGCNGGFMEWAYQYIQTAGGIVSEEDYPYIGADGTCDFDATKVVAKVKDYTFYEKNEQSMAVALVDRGPLAIALNASFLQFYFFGVFDPIWCPSSLNHAVTLVGYGEEKKPFWIIKNSWGSLWGEDGYFRMVRGKGKCGVDQYTITANLE